MDHGLETLLIKLNGIIELKRRQLESLTREYTVLLKPWPKNKNQEEENRKKDETKIEEKDRGSEISAEEQTGVHMVEKVLVQAQRARLLKEKLKRKQNINNDLCEPDLLSTQSLEADELCEDSETSIRSKLRNSIIQEKRKNADNLSKKIKDNESKSKESVEEKSEHKQTEKRNDNATCSQSKDVSHGRVPSHSRNVSYGRVPSHSRDVSHGRVPSHSRDVSHGRNSSKTKFPSMESNHALPKKPQSRSASNNRNQSNIENSTSVTRSASQGRRGTTEVELSKGTFKEPRAPRPISSHGRPYSAHVNAPFKTDPTLRVPRTTSNKSAMAARKPPITRGRQVNPKPEDSQRTLKTGSHKIQACSDNKSGEVHDDKYVNNQKTLNKDLKQFGFEDKDDSLPDLLQEAVMADIASPGQSAPAAVDTEPIKTLAAGVKALRVTEPAKQDGQDTAPQDKLFSLLTDGNKIPVPGKLKRLVSTNQKLAEKVATLRVTKRVESQDAKLSFMSRLDGEFWADRDLVEQTQVLSCLSAYTRLLQLLEGLQLDSISELTAVEDVLAAKMKMEYILSSCDCLQDLMNSLSVADIEVDSNITGPDIPCLQEAGMYQWLPGQLHGDVPASPRPDSLVYRTRTDLQTYRQHSFQLQYLQLQSAITARVQTELLPLLQNMDAKSGDYIPVYRAVFSLLTSDGQHLPGIVKDS